MSKGRGASQSRTWKAAWLDLGSGRRLWEQISVAVGRSVRVILLSGRNRERVRPTIPQLGDKGLAFSGDKLRDYTKKGK